jgi:hypothetical protein
MYSIIHIKRIGVLIFLLGISTILILLLQRNDTMSMLHWMELVGIELIVQLLVHEITKKDENIHTT